MQNGIQDLLGVAIPAIALGVAAIILMVQRELGPFSRLSTGGKWLLTGAFGMGILAFAVKISVAVAVTRMPVPVSAASPPLEAPSAVAQQVWAYQPDAPQKYVWQALPQMAPEPPDNPATPEKIALGKRLFFDKALSADGQLSCASCHDLYGKAGGDGRRTARGIAGQIGGRNAPTVWNAAFQSQLFWDGRAASLEEQAQGPILNPLEMGMPSAAAVEAVIRKNPLYQQAFAQVFGAEQPITLARIAAAIAAYERTLITPDAPYDRFVRGDRQALNPQQLRGMARFESVGCVTCHKGPNFSDASLVGGQIPRRIFPALPTAFEKRFDLTPDGRGGGVERGAWRIPSLRNVALTGPYFHNGAVEKLSDAVRIMAGAQLGTRIGAAPQSGELYWSSRARVLNRVESRTLNEQDVDDIVAFLQALSSDTLASHAGKSGA
ncbi:MAG: c-type cytochrome [Sulfuricella sp.]|nr:c-type cytochrome [Sulfuricella sp.]